MYECTDSVMSILPLDEILDRPSGDNYPDSVIGILDKKRKDPWYPALVQVIQDEGFTVPIRIDSAGWVVDGHHRIAAAMELGMAWVPVTSAEWADHQHTFRQDNSDYDSWWGW